MASAAAPPPIVGTPIDPPPAEVPGFAEKLDRTTVGGIGYRALRRYSHANVALLTSGTAYYLFLSLLSLLALTYGVIAILGADQLAEKLTDILGDALPNLVGENGIDPQELRSTGRAAGVVGLVLLLYSTLSAVRGASSSMHVIFGAPPDPRSFVKAKARHVLLLLVVTPLLAVSFASASLTSSLIQPLLDAIGWDAAPARAALVGVGLLVGLAIDALIMWILLGTLGGIRPGSTSSSHLEPDRCRGRRPDQAATAGHRRVVPGQAAVRRLRPTAGGLVRPVAVDQRALCVRSHHGGHQRPRRSLGRARANPRRPGRRAGPDRGLTGHCHAIDLRICRHGLPRRAASSLLPST